MVASQLKRGLVVVAVVLLALQVVGLAALAKQAQSLPSSDPAHFLSNATKMIVSHLSSPLPPALECVLAIKLCHDNHKPGPFTG
jgi:hypothetical protein